MPTSWFLQQFTECDTNSLSCINKLPPSTICHLRGFSTAGSARSPGVLCHPAEISAVMRLGRKPHLRAHVNALSTCSWLTLHPLWPPGLTPPLHQLPWASKSLRQLPFCPWERLSGWQTETQWRCVQRCPLQRKRKRHSAARAATIFFGRIKLFRSHRITFLQGISHFAIGCLVLAFNFRNSVHELSVFPFAHQNVFFSTKRLPSFFLCSLSSFAPPLFNLFSSSPSSSVSGTEAQQIHCFSYCPGTSIVSSWSLRFITGFIALNSEVFHLKNSLEGQNRKQNKTNTLSILFESLTSILY